MSARLLDGELLAGRIKMELADRAARLSALGRPVGLGTVLVGDDGPSEKYVAMKHADCDEVGIRSFHEHLSADATQSDVEGLHPTNLGRLVMGRPGPLPCTPAGIVELLADNHVPVEGRRVVVIGRGLTIGRPLALLLALRRPGCNAAVTVVHTGVDDMSALVRTADVIVACAGVAGLVSADMVKPGAAVVGAGTSWVGKRLMSDVADEVAEVAGWITPRIGGVGPMTRAMLLRNAVLAAEKIR